MGLLSPFHLAGRTVMMRHGFAPLLLAIFTLPAPAAPVAVRDFRTQKVGDVIYFHVRLAPPKPLPPADSKPKEEAPANAESPIIRARLVAPDGKARHVYRRRAAGPVAIPGA